MSPKRIQRKRTKGWRMPEGAVYVGRPSRWGNPIDWTGYPTLTRPTPPDYEDEPTRIPDETRRRWAVIDFEDALTRTGFGLRLPYPDPETIRAELAGRDLACWCPLAQPCHADVLLEIANGSAS